MAEEDTRTENERTLDAINAALEGRADQDVSSYMIGTRRLDRIPMPELLRMRSVFITAVRREKGKLFGSVKMVDV